jgi:hypothetical protein
MPNRMLQIAFPFFPQFEARARHPPPIPPEFGFTASEF